MFDYTLNKTGADNKASRLVNGSAKVYQDNYTGFSWKGVHSSAYNCFIQNTGHLEFVGAPDFSNTFVSPSFQAHSYFTGSTMQSKKLTLNLIFYQITIEDLNRALNWLNPLDSGELILDYSPLWKYIAKLSSIGVIEKYVAGKTIVNIGQSSSPNYVEDLYICKVAVGFETVFNYEAISRYTLGRTFNTVQEEEITTATTTSKPINLIPVTVEDDQYTQISDTNNSLISIIYNNSSKAITTKNVKFASDTADKKIIILTNNGSVAIPYKIEFYNIHNGISVWDYSNYSQDIDNYKSEAPISSSRSTPLIAYTTLLLDNEQYLNVTYNSEYGTMTCCDRLLQEIHGFRGKFLASYVSSMSNQYIEPHSSVYLYIEDDNNTTASYKATYAIYFDNYEYVL